MKKIIICSAILSCFSLLQLHATMRPRTSSIGVQKSTEEFFLNKNSTLLNNQNFKHFSPITFKESGELYTFAFNVGQANFIMLRRGNRAVLVDAGIADREKYAKTYTFTNKLFKDVKIERVFITHPHDDHFSMFCSNSTKDQNGLSDLYAEQFKGTKFTVGGAKDTWNTKACKSFVEKAEKLGDIEFIGEDFSCKSYTLLDGVDFRIFGLSSFDDIKANEKNRLSLMIQVSMNSKKMLFLGDSEGDSIDRVKGVSMELRNMSMFADDQQNKQLGNLYQEIDELVKTKILNFENDSSNTIWVNEKDCTKFVENYWSLYEPFKSYLTPKDPIEAFLGFNLNDFKDLEKKITDLVSDYASAKEDLEEKEEILKNHPSEIETQKEEVKNAKNTLKDITSKLDVANENKIALAQELVEVTEGFESEQSNLNELEEELSDAKKTIESIRNKLPQLEFELKDSLEKFKNIEAFKKISEEPLKQIYADFFSENVSKWEETSPSEYIEKFAKTEILKNYINTIIKRVIFEKSQLVFLPHHGTNSKNSQRFFGYFSGLKGARTYVVNSTPFGEHGLPKRSTLEMAPSFPTHKEHPFIYSQDQDKNTVSMVMTDKPIYVTGVAPGGIYCFKISERYEDKSIYMLNDYETTPTWFNVLGNYE